NLGTDCGYETADEDRRSCRCDSSVSNIFDRSAADGCRHRSQAPTLRNIRQAGARVIQGISLSGSGRKRQRLMSTQEVGMNIRRGTKRDADFVFYELTRSICPDCRKVIDAQVILRDNKVYMRKRCPQCGPFEALIYADAAAYVALSKYNKPGTIPLARGTDTHHGCPYDCGLCPDHQQHTCLGIV